MWLNMVKIAARTELINGPIYGMIFKIAHKKAMIKALFTPKINSTIRYMMKMINNCNNNPMKYLDNNSLIFATEFKI